MKKYQCFALLFLFTGTLFAQQNAATLNLIPVPVSIKQGQGQCMLPYNATIYYNGQEDARKIVNQLADRLNTGGNLIQIKKGKSALPGSINYVLTNEPGIPAEGYQLIVNKKISRSKPVTRQVYSMALRPSCNYYPQLLNFLKDKNR